MDKFDKEITEVRRRARVENITALGPHLHWDYLARSKSLKSTYNNTLNILEVGHDLKGLFGYNLFKDEVELIKHPVWDDITPLPRHVNDNDLMELKNHLRTYYSYEPSTNILNEAVVSIALRNKYNPVKEYLTGLKWDGTARLATWLNYYCNAEESDYTRYIGQMTLVAACKRVDQPGCQYDYMLILEGDQGIYKSQMVHALGSPWCKKIGLMDPDKETLELMRGCWIVEVAELEAFKKREIESLKAFITTQVDKARLAYDRRSREFPRKSIFISTINPGAGNYLRDQTGNRRFLPVKVSDIKINEIRRDKDQLWAEAWHKYQNGFKVYMPKYIEDYAKQMQDERNSPHPWIETIEPWILDQIDKRNMFVTHKDIFNDALKLATDRNSQHVHSIIAEIMLHLGIQLSKKKKFLNGSSYRYYDLNFYKNIAGSETDETENDNLEGPEMDPDFWKLP